LSFIICFNFFSIGLSRSHDPFCRLGMLTRFVDWKLSFIICFNFFPIELSRSHDLFRKFGRLTHFFFFHHSILGFFLLSFIICFDLFFFLWGYHGLMTRYGDWQVNSTWVKSIQYVIVLIFTHTRKSHLKYLF
jgi:hypothetical protein